MERLPIIIGEETVGSVELRREGAYMLCRGTARWSGEMLRLWLYGQGEPGYLGVLLPEGNTARVRKKFSMADYAKLPHPLEYCAPQARTSKPSEEDVYWYPVGDGTLIGTLEGKRYRAFPAHDLRLPRSVTVMERVIEGKPYILFPG